MRKSAGFRKRLRTILLAPGPIFGSIITLLLMRPGGVHRTELQRTADVLILRPQMQALLFAGVFLLPVLAKLGSTLRNAKEFSKCPFGRLYGRAAGEEGSSDSDIEDRQGGFPGAEGNAFSPRLGAHLFEVRKELSRLRNMNVITLMFGDDSSMKWEEDGSARGAT